MADPSLGHKYGAYHVENVLNWCEKTGIRHVTVFVCSTENLTSRGDAEVAYLMQVIEQVIVDKLSRDPAWQVHLAGALDMLPDTTAQALKRAVEASRDCATGAHITLAVGYGGRQEVIEFEDTVLARVPAHGGTVVARDTVINRRDGDPLEVQILEMPDEQALAAYMNDPERLAVLERRDSIIARTQMLRLRDTPSA